MTKRDINTKKSPRAKNHQAQTIKFHRAQMTRVHQAPNRNKQIHPL